MRLERNKDTDILEFIGVRGRLISIEETPKTLTNAKGESTDYHICEVEVDYGDGDTEEIRASLWATSLEMFKEKFVPNAKIGLTIQAEGEYEGYAKVQLPGLTANVAKLRARFAGKATPAGAPDATAKESAKKQPEELTTSE